MAKIKRGISGKFEDVVHGQGSRYKPHVRKAIAGGGNSNEPAFKAQHERTIFLNGLAADLNAIVRQYAPLLKPASFYHDLQKEFRKEPLNHRFLLLWRLKGMEVNKRYKLGTLSYHEVEVNVAKKKLAVSLHVKGHAYGAKQQFDCYYYDVLLLTWDSTSGAAAVQRQVSDWVDVGGRLPVFDFEFALPKGVVHWMVCVRIVLGSGKQGIGSIGAEGMAVAEVGSLDKEDWKLLEERKAVKGKGKEDSSVVEVVRVKARE